MAADVVPADSATAPRASSRSPFIALMARARRSEDDAVNLSVTRVLLTTFGEDGCRGAARPLEAAKGAFKALNHHGVANWLQLLTVHVSRRFQSGTCTQ